MFFTIAYPLAARHIMQIDVESVPSSGMNGPFVLPSNWMYDSIATTQFWNTSRTDSEGMDGYTGAPEIQSHLIDLTSLSPSSTSSGHMSCSSGPSESFTVDQASPASSGVSGSSNSWDTHASIHAWSSPAGPDYASLMMGSPEPLEPEGHYGFDGVPYCGGFLPANLAYPLPFTSRNSERVAEVGLRHTPAGGTRAKKPRSRVEKPNIPSCRTSTSGDESPIVCPSCQRRFTCRPSLHRHRKESQSCGSESGTRLFYCDPRDHPGCKRSFKRRCGLKEHYKKLGFSGEEADAKIREHYGKGMHRRRN